MTCLRSDLHWRDALNNAVSCAPGGVQDAAAHISKRRGRSISTETLRKKLRGVEGESVSMEMAEILTEYLQRFVGTQAMATDWVCSLAAQFGLMVDYVPAPPLAGWPDELAAIQAKLLELHKLTGQLAGAGIDALADRRLTVTEDVARGKLLAKLAASGQPLAGGFSITDVVPEEDNQRRAQVNALLARAGVLTGADAESARNGNPYAHTTLLALAERSLIQAGVNTRGMDREQIARGVLAVQTTSDFPVLLENVLHRVLVGAYNLQQFTWTRFCATGTLSDYRPHSRFHLSSFSDLKPVNEAGEYENGVLGDGEVETIKGARKGRILQITPEVLVNDDLGAFVRITTALGQAAGRTIEKDVYDVLKQNGGLGPVMKDGHTLFHAEHGNIAAGAAVSVDSFDAMRQMMALQMDPGGNDYLDISLSRFLGTVAMHGRATLVNNSEYNPDVTGKFQVNNTSRATFSDIITSPRLGTGKGWYGFADPNVEPVIEVAFLNGVQTPVLEQETNFRTDGLSWKVVHKYGVGAVGWRGAAFNPGE